MMYGIFGDVDAPPKLVRAALSDLLETHGMTSPDEDFWLLLGIRHHKVGIYGAIMSWAERNKVYYEIIHAQPNYDIADQAAYKAVVGPNEAVHSKRFMLDVVERLHDEQGPATLLALVGDVEPSTDVLRAIAKAVDNGTEVRDLAEAGLTYIRFHGDQPPQESEEDNTMPTKKAAAAPVEEEETTATLEELGEYADGDDEETSSQAIDLLTEAAGEVGIDPDEYDTWTEVAAAIAEASEPEEAEPDPEPEGEEWTADNIGDISLPEARKLAKSLSIEGAAKMRREDLVKAISEAQGWGAKKAPAKKAAAKPAAAKSKAEEPEDDVDVDAMATDLAKLVLAKMGELLADLGA